MSESAEDRADEARKVAPKRGRPKAPEPQGDDDEVSTVLTLKGRRAWKRWLKAAADEERASETAIIDRALIAYAKATGLPPMPSRLRR